ncbi:MAG: 5'/3'-nucleotidase SurE [Rhodobacteraceae bacterium]|nr:5'/3'-nucleotidase SurE [Paracoccaceae bacterium]
MRIARIVISNDDGLTSNILALYNALKAAGHDVIVSVPCQNQSGTGTSLNQGLPAPTLAQACRCGSAAAGAPSAGPMQREGIGAGDFFYVEGTPVMAVLYGIDVLAQGRWGKPPDLVLSGPNEGQNVGSIIVNSGTVSVVQMALARGIAAIALSAGANSADDATLANPLSKLIATLSVQLVRSLLAHAGQGKILPAGLGLNVNFPDNPEGAAWKAAVVGSYSAYDFVFVPDMQASASPMVRQLAHEHGLTLPNAPGLSVQMNDAPPLPSQQNDESVVYKTAIAVSPIQAGYAPAAMQDIAARVVQGLDEG